MEIWTDIEGFENYQVSTWGRVRSSKCILKPYENQKGYLKVGLTRDGKCHKKRVNRLVAQAFIPNPNGLPQVDHIDGNKQNNSVTNLRWVDNATNQQIACRMRNAAIPEELMRILRESPLETIMVGKE